MPLLDRISLKMNLGNLLDVFLVVSLGCQLISNLVGSKVALFMYVMRIEKFKNFGLTFAD